MHQDSADLGAIADIYAKLEQEAVETLTRDGIERSRMRLVREADVRYAGQSMEVRVPAPGGAVDAQFLARLIDAFNAAHKRTFGYNYAGQQKIEIVNFCVSGFGLIERPEIPKLAKRDRCHARPQVGPAGLFRRRVPRHAGLRPRGAARPASGSTALPSSRSSAPPPSCFPASTSRWIRMAC